MTVLQDLAQQGITVICSIHQPSSEISAMFQNLILLCEGQTVYAGNAKTSLEYFNKVTAAHNLSPAPVDSNPVDIYMKWMYVGSEISKAHTDRIAILKAAWKNQIELQISNNSDSKLEIIQ
eukprot:CAMPEP_0116898592 /NCGR_PEP_ID=MMETSP0467-20121206/7300_1 /TAXON_ID=283647 /ORGANISM="Mesodinium pulex, Strain SPMC105" /LENGTH=120 /DNA_ID=CAMNT_0004570845 /DNA_START=543 /DNA_END=905 /DNA_ORIENTATION=+